MPEKPSENTLFQFLHGTIKGPYTLQQGITVGQKFQFLHGTIKGMFLKFY